MQSQTAFRGNALYEYITPHEYGTIIRYQEIERVTGTKRNTPAYYNTIAKAKKLLEANGKMIVSIEGGDYRIIYPGDYTTAYVKEVKKARNRIKHGQEILDGAPVKDMNTQEVEAYNRVHDFSARLNASFSGSVVEVKKLVARKHPMEAALDANDAR